MSNLSEVKDSVEQVFPKKAFIKWLENTNPSQDSSHTELPAELLYEDKRHSLLFISMQSSSRAALSEIKEEASEKGSVVYYLVSTSPQLRKELKEKEINFIDKAGNAWIEFSEMYIDREGFNSPKKEGKRRPGWCQNIFADKASIISRILLEENSMGVREISEYATKEGFPLTPGYVSKITRALLDRKYAEKDENGRIFLVRKKEFLRDWVEEYQRINHSQIFGYYHFSESLAVSMRELSSSLGKEEYVFSGQAGASLVDAYTQYDAIDLFVHDVEGASILLEKRGIKAVDRGANVRVSEPYYKVSSFYGARSISGMKVASNLQLYLDLMCEPKRGLEAAEHLYERVLGKELGFAGEKR